MISEAELMYSAFTNSCIDKTSESFPLSIVDVCDANFIEANTHTIMINEEVSDGRCILLTNMGFEFCRHQCHDTTKDHGSITWEDGTNIEGTVVNNTINGEATIKWANHDEYVGSVLHNIRHGKGSFVSDEGNSVYSGYWINGRRQGYGEQKYADGSIYKGNWENNKREGYGVLCENGGKYFYAGNWVNNVRDGNGIMIWWNLEKEHNYLNSKSINNNCNLEFIEIFEGEWHGNVADGRGRCVYALCNKNTSVTKDEVNNVESVTIKSNRSNLLSINVVNIYDGEVKNGCREGSGTFYYADGSVYCGEWKNNLKNGKGAYISNDGKVTSGVFVDNKLSNHWRNNNCDSMTKKVIEADKNIPILFVDDLCGVCDKGTAEMADNISLLLFKYNSLLKEVFGKYCHSHSTCKKVVLEKNKNYQEKEKKKLPFSYFNYESERKVSELECRLNIAEVLLDEAFVPGHVTLTQLIKCLHDANILDKFTVTITTVLQLVEQVLCIERRQRSLELNKEFASLINDQLEITIKRITYISGGYLSYRQFVEFLVRLCPLICTGNLYVTLYEKFSGLVQKLINLSTYTCQDNTCWLFPSTLEDVYRSDNDIPLSATLEEIYFKMLNSQKDVNELKKERMQNVETSLMKLDNNSNCSFLKICTLTEKMLLQISSKYHVSISDLYYLLECIICAKDVQIANGNILCNSESSGFKQQEQQQHQHGDCYNINKNESKSNKLFSYKHKTFFDTSEMTVYLDVEISLPEFIYYVVNIFMLCNMIDSQQTTVCHVLTKHKFDQFIADYI